MLHNEFNDIELIVSRKIQSFNKNMLITIQLAIFVGRVLNFV